MQKRSAQPVATRYGVARVLSKRGLCSRRQGEALVREGRVKVNGRVVRDPAFPVDPQRDHLEIDQTEARAGRRCCLMLNKPRGLVTTRSDEQGRDTVYRCLEGADLPWLAPVGRLDKASEGLLLFCNDPVWAAALLDPARGPSKTYHVQIDRIADAALLQAMRRGIAVEGESRPLAVAAVRLLRAGQRNCWLEIVLEEGRNRQIRRLLGALDVGVLRLLRVAIGDLALGDLGKGQWRWLSAEEMAALAESMG
jgi:23S rRNA pseudouridine2605 synthase